MGFACWPDLQLVRHSHEFSKRFRVHFDHHAGPLHICPGLGFEYRRAAGITRVADGAPVAFVGTAIVRVPMLRRHIRVEEAMMLERFGAEYEAYAQGTKRMIPGVYWRRPLNRWVCMGLFGPSLR